MATAISCAGWSGGAGAEEPLFLALADTVRRHRLPWSLLHDLLSAFRQDVTVTRYADFDQLHDYCRRSANPVGRLLLHLFGAADEENLRLSDHICTALQLINFCQDVVQDYTENGRIYLPQEEMAACGVSEADLHHRRNRPALRRLLEQQRQRAEGLLRTGAPLGGRLSGRAGLEIRMIVQGGARVAERLARREDPFTRPRLTRLDGARIALRALFWRS